MTFKTSHSESLRDPNSTESLRDLNSTDICCSHLEVYFVGPQILITRTKRQCKWDFFFLFNLLNDLALGLLSRDHAFIFTEKHVYVEITIKKPLYIFVWHFKRISYQRVQLQYLQNRKLAAYLRSFVCMNFTLFFLNLIFSGVCDPELFLEYIFLSSLEKLYEICWSVCYPCCRMVTWSTPVPLTSINTLSYFGWYT
jgi:hypothetical protein